MIIIETDKNFYAPANIEWYWFFKTGKGLKYKINFIILSSPSFHDENLVNLFKLGIIDKVYVKNNKEIELIKKLKICDCQFSSNSNIEMIRKKCFDNICKKFKKLLSEEEILKLSNSLHKSNYIMFYNIVDDSLEEIKPIIKI